MAQVLTIPIFPDERGDLAVIQDICPFDIKRVFHIHDVPSNETRGKHGHLRNKMLLTAVKGMCSIYYNNGEEKETILLDSPAKGLVLDPNDWHKLSNFSAECVLLVLCSEEYSSEDYFYEEPND